MVTRPFEAKYYGTCAACDERIRPGDMITFEEDDTMHETCTDSRAHETKQKPCPTCWLVGPCDCQTSR